MRRAARRHDTAAAREPVGPQAGRSASAPSPVRPRLLLGRSLPALKVIEHPASRRPGDPTRATSSRETRPHAASRTTVARKGSRFFTFVLVGLTDLGSAARLAAWLPSAAGAHQAACPRRLGAFFPSRRNSFSTVGGISRHPQAFAWATCQWTRWLRVEPIGMTCCLCHLAFINGELPETASSERVGLTHCRSPAARTRQR